MRILKQFRKLTLIMAIAFVAFACQKQINYGTDIVFLNDQIQAIQKRTDSLTSAIALSNMNQANLSKSIDSIRIQIGTITSQITILNNQINTASANIASINTQIAALNTKLNELLIILNTYLSQNTISNGLVAYYPFNGTVNDVSGNGNNGTIVNSVSYGPDNENNPNAALVLGNGRVITNTSMFNFQYTSSFTVSFWFQNGGSASGRLISTENPEGNFRIASYGDGVYAYAFGGMPYIYDTVELNKWNHISYVYSNRNIIIYKNGQPKVNSISATNEFLKYGTPFTIGQKAASAYDNWSGKIDELRIYNRAINSQEAEYLSKQ